MISVDDEALGIFATLVMERERYHWGDSDNKNAKFWHLAENAL
jgi:hypothetical protein